MATFSTSSDLLAHQKRPEKWKPSPPLRGALLRPGSYATPRRDVDAPGDAADVPTRPRYGRSRELNIDAFPDGDADNSNPDDVANPSFATEDSKNNVEEFKRFLEELNGPTDLSAKRQGEVSTTPLDLSGPDEPYAKPRTGVARVESDSEDTQDQYPTDGNDVNMSENGDSVIYYEQQTSPGSIESGRLSTAGGQAKRFRTQMSSVQIRIMKSIFHDYKTPTMAECESLGAQIGLPKRVIQVWFQNARAKEKKTKAAALKLGQAPDPEPVRPEQCDICNARYESFSSSLQDHLFSPSHISQLRAYLELNKDEPESTPSAAQSSGALLPAPGPSPGSGGELIRSFSPEHSQLVQQLQLLSQLNAQQQDQQQMPLDDGGGGGGGVVVTPTKSVDASCNNNPTAPPDDFSLFGSAGGGVNGGPSQFGAFFGAQGPAAPLFSSASRQ
ncbi:zinc finger homeobox protein 4-like [Tropilaelaps mercedesae]|uniref:Zinc finger homeobox protein 4-like n=1 Tax=Tropilaelaps mercedesae TaxID=418985 RepID=A0A1V9XCX7_9ACAR|nr:zinc finger homeobox protein 4-like [Tropilaelaps mercedesae]